LYFDELAGKGLDLVTIFKFLLYFSPSVMLNVVPLSILLGGIMSYGSLSEQSEFTAMKSMGISLVQSMKAIALPIILLAVGTFIFANTALPYGNYKFSNLRRNIKKKMPSIAISEGVFNDFKMAGINIYVKKKYGENKNKLEEVLIHQKVNGIPDKVITAKSGIFKSDTDNQLIQLVLYDGYFYEDLTRQQKNVEDKKRSPAMMSKFKEHVINIDISDLNKVNLDDNSVKNAYHMLNVVDLQKEIDTINKKTKHNFTAFSDEFLKRNVIKKINQDSVVSVKNFKDVYAVLADSTLIKNAEFHGLLSRAVNKADALMMFSKRKEEYFYRQNINYNKYIYAINSKYSFPLSVIVMFLVGVPLGTIIKKGGFGISVVFGIVIFITYYILTMIGKNAAEEGAIPAFSGAWLSTAVLLPLGLFLAYKANNDGEFTWFSNSVAFIKDLFVKKKRIKN
jgi:lipopolysaccharide export system permease protein